MKSINLEKLDTIEGIKDVLNALLEIPEDLRDGQIVDKIAYLQSLLELRPDSHYYAEQYMLDISIDSTITSSHIKYILEEPVIEDVVVNFDIFKFYGQDDLFNWSAQSDSLQYTEPVIFPETFTLKAITIADQIMVNNPTPGTADGFGLGVSISGDYTIVGAYNDNTGASSAGSAYIYDVTTGNLLYTLNNPTPQSSERFGFHNGISISGDYAIVGAQGDDTGASDAGSAYIYDVTTGNLLYTLNNPTPASSDYFGYSASISGDYAIVGAYGDNTNASGAGSAYIYDVSTGNLLVTLNNPTPASSDYFGSTVSISDDYAIVAAFGDNTGASSAGSAYIYDVTTGNLLYTLNNPTPASSDGFGSGISISADYVIVGAQGDDTGASDAGSAYIYDVTTGNLLYTLNNPTPASSDNFGQSVSNFGNYAIVGAYRDDTGTFDAGSAYIYDVTTGDLLYTLNNPTPGLFDYFGQNVSMSGNDVIVGSPGDNTGATSAGSAYIYKGDFDSDGVVNGSTLDDTLYGLDGDDILSGLGGDDTLYGGTGADTFSFEDQGATDFDRIEDFSAGDGDILDISDLLTGFTEGSEIEDYARILDDTVNIGHSYLMVDNNGGADASLDFVAIAYIVNGAGLDISTLYDNGQVIAL